MRARELLRQVLPPIVVGLLRRAPDVPDRGLYRSLVRYQPRFSPWFGDPAFVAAYESARSVTLKDPEGAWVLWSLARQCARLGGGDFIEAGVFRGGSAMLIWDAMRPAPEGGRLHLFASFAGLPAPGIRDLLHEGDMSETSVDEVARLFDDPRVVIHPGWIPATFGESGVSSVAFAHVDVDLERSVLDSAAFIYSHLRPGGVIVFDDYGLPCCPGARAAVDEFFRDLPETPLVLSTGQAVVFRLPQAAPSLRQAGGR
jgi:O-methyltransferase